MSLHILSIFIAVIILLAGVFVFNRRTLSPNVRLRAGLGLVVVAGCSIMVLWGRSFVVVIPSFIIGVGSILYVYHVLDKDLDHRRKLTGRGLPKLQDMTITAYVLLTMAKRGQCRLNASQKQSIHKFTKRTNIISRIWDKAIALGALHHASMSTTSDKINKFVHDIQKYIQ